MEKNIKKNVYIGLAKKLQKNPNELYGQLNIRITESLCCTAEINTTL